jgi:WS/DGAT/MGAT family acyltransferase
MTERMAAVDAAWLHMDRPVNELIVNAVLWFDDPLDAEDVREAIERRLVGRYPRFAQRVDDRGTAAWWVDQPGFDPMSHVSHERLRPPGDLAELTRTVTELIARPLPRDRPLWAIHVLDGYAGGTALLARIHHCLADGVALFRVLLSLSDEAQDGGLPAPETRRPSAPSSLRQRLTRVAVGTGKAGRALGELLLLPPDRRTALRAELGGHKVAHWSEPLPLEPIKAAAREAGATINDIVLAALAGAVRRRFAGAGAPLVDVRAVLPVNLRALDKREVELGNRFGLVFLRLPVTVPDPVGRIAAVHRRASALKRSAVAPVALRILSVAGRLPAPALRLLITVFTAKASMVVTNVPGPRTPLHLGGHRIAGVIAWPPQSGSIGLGVSVISYDGSVVLGVMADDRVVDDSAQLLADLREELLGRLAAVAA